MKKSKVLLVGPKINISNKKSYGGGTGGYTRNMSVYLKFFKFSDIDIIPCFHTINGEYSLGVFTKPIRLIADICNFFIKYFQHKIYGVHILAQYRGAVMREFFIVLISTILKTPVLYEIKAGSFKNSYIDSGIIYKKAINFIIKNSKIILIEGKSDETFLKENFNKDSVYFPNVVPVDEIPKLIEDKFQNDILKVLFVGYAYLGKGIVELLDACQQLALNGTKVSLTIVGEIHDDIKIYINHLNVNDNLILYSKGKLHHDKVLHEFKLNDVYCYPSKHPGEGHNNTINEALMHEMVVCSTLNGFLGSFLNEENSYPITNLSAKNIELRLTEIKDDIITAKLKASKGRQLILAQFNTDKAKEILEKKYHQLFK